MERKGLSETSSVGAAAGAVAENEPALQGVLSAAPSWLGSAIVHLLVFLLLCQIPWSTPDPRPQTLNAAIVERRELPVTQDRNIERPEVKDHEMLHPQLKPMETVGANIKQDLDRVDFDLAPLDTNFDRDDEPPPPIRALALGHKGPRGKETIYGLRGKGGGGRGGPYGGPPGVRDSRNLGLWWLAKVQEPDGHWDARKWGANHNCDAGVTGLALLAFLCDGNTDMSGRYRRNVHRALVWLSNRQASDGNFGERFYTQGICTMAVCEAYGMAQSPRWRPMAQKAIDYCCTNQNPNGGWDYLGNNPNRVDTSVTGWLVMGIKSGVASGLNVPTDAIERIKKWLRESVNADGTTGYTKKIAGQGSSGGTPPMTAVAALCRIFMGASAQHPNITRPLEYLSKRGVDLNNLYHTYYGTLVMHQARRVYPKYWQRWNGAFENPLMAKQVKNGPPELKGSWPPNVTYGGHGGRVYSTALSILCLEARYSYLPVLRRTEI